MLRTDIIKVANLFGRHEAKACVMNVDVDTCENVVGETEGRFKEKSLLPSG